MLKAIELIGFKSFADRTRLEFPEGITVVVGPNGSGKSNIVDAIKWVLGEQSARSLRGKEMADVIFKGGGNRKAANTAEATIYFDNSTNLLPYDAEEVRVTRRVYRSGEGEYLVNGEACRLRDIKDMFRGTGMGAGAYSLIEQGRVDAMLKASPKDRRAMFEEAAGISRFNAKKVESQRRLERVDQNLLRLSDIVDEVDSRLRRLKSQASKARRYKEHSDRLRELRTHVGRVDWQRLTADINSITAELAAVVAEVSTGQQQLEDAESNLRIIETESAHIDDQLHEYEAQQSLCMQRVAALESTVTHGRESVEELTEEIQRFQRQYLAMTNRAGHIQDRAIQVAHELADARAEHSSRQSELESAREALDETTRELQECRAHSDERRNHYLDQVRLTTEVQNQIASLQSSLAQNDASRTQIEDRLQGVAAEHETADAELQSLQQSLSEAIARFEDVEAARSETKTNLEAAQAKLAAFREQCIESQQRRAVIGERVGLLEEIERRMEGIGASVQHVLRQAEVEDCPLKSIHGMVADLLQVVDRKDARIVAAALGERSQHLVVEGTALMDALVDGSIQLAGRVGLVRLQSSSPPDFLRQNDLSGKPGVFGRVDQLVSVEPPYQYLVEWLLGDTWIVDSLSTAVNFYRTLSVPPRFVTLEGEVLERDGRMMVGPENDEMSLISRRSELKTLREEIEEYDEQRQSQDDQLTQCEGDVRSVMDELAALDERVEMASREMTKQQLATEVNAKQVARLADSLQALEAERANVDASDEEGRQQLLAAQSQFVEFSSLVESLEATLSGDHTRVDELDALQREHQELVTVAEVLCAKAEQRLESLQAEHDQLKRDQNDRAAALDDVWRQLNRSKDRQATAELAILRASSETNQLYLQRDDAAEQSRDTVNRRGELKRERVRLLELSDSVRGNIRDTERRQNQQQLEVERLRLERESVSERLQEDYGIEISHLNAEIGADELLERQSIDEEISAIRRKITNIGSVNMESLEELAELESRYESLSGQYQDLVDAKETLEKIIQKINADSRRLFAETLEAIKANFSVLFRKIFGGGRADLVLEEGVDILESGIDIVATPPGKQSLAISLLSGGERALTAVTLLLAIFQYRPSPFCVLDEVDGPLDEANIGRFIDVLNGFLDWTKFVVVTHSKTTMTAANTLYGITMQESGVSKRVSVRFEDVNERGEISDDATRRSAG